MYGSEELALLAAGIYQSARNTGGDSRPGAFLLLERFMCFPSDICGIMLLWHIVLLFLFLEGSSGLPAPQDL